MTDQHDVTRTDTGGGPRRTRGSLGAISLRVVLALGASTGLTAAVALPMAYQAYDARREAQVVVPAAESPQVLGTVVEPAGQVGADGVEWRPEGTSESPVPLHTSTISGPGRIVFGIDGTDRVDLRVDDGAVLSLTEPPFEVAVGTEAPAVPLAAGAHTLTATISSEDGTVALRQADFTVG